MKKMLISILVTFYLLILGSQPVSALSSESILNFDSQILITKDNTAKIVETIKYDFAYTYHHGIYRDIPIDYKDGGTTYYVNFKLDNVLDENGISQKTELDTVNGNKRIKIGDPNKTITGIHTYKISYELSPIITLTNSKPFLNLDVLGEGWEVPVDILTANVSLEDGQQLSNIGWYGSTNTSSDLSELKVSDIPAFTGVTINANLPDGYVTKYLQPNQQRLSDVMANIFLIVSSILVVTLFTGAGIIILIRKVRSAKRRKNQTVIPEYEPPKGLSPAEVGMLQDDIAEGREITATIINWAVSGYIKIGYIPKKNIFTKKDYELTIIKDTSTLPKIESDLMYAFFSVAKEIKLSKINKMVASTGITKFKKDLKSKLTKSGYYDDKGQIFMRGTLTEDGAKQWAKVDGFRLYLCVAEKDRLNFFNAPEKTPEKFSEYLPYAIALGVEKEWAKQFKDIDLSETTDWYAGNFATFSAVSIASDIGNSFASTVSTNSSYSSGGGVGGGGFGGGGGGSW
jgi:uncharacterized membrane protein